MYKSKQTNYKRNTQVDEANRGIRRYQAVLESVLNAAYPDATYEFLVGRDVSITGANIRIKTKDGDIYALAIAHKKYDDFDTFGLWEDKVSLLKRGVVEYDEDQYYILVFDPNNQDNYSFEPAIPIFQKYKADEYKSKAYEDKTFFIVPFNKN